LNRKTIGGTLAAALAVGAFAYSSGFLGARAEAQPRVDAARVAQTKKVKDVLAQEMPESANRLLLSFSGDGYQHCAYRTRYDGASYLGDTAVGDRTLVADFENAGGWAPQQLGAVKDGNGWHYSLSVAGGYPADRLQDIDPVSLQIALSRCVARARQASPDNAPALASRIQAEN